MNNFIEIHNIAYDELIKLLEVHSEYNCVALKLAESCCKHSTVDVLLDELGDNIPTYKFKDLSIICDSNIVKTFSKIELKYENNTFMVKCIPIDNTLNNSCSGNSKGCSGCSGCKEK